METMDCVFHQDLEWFGLKRGKKDRGTKVKRHQDSKNSQKNLLQSVAARAFLGDIPPSFRGKGREAQCPAAEKVSWLDKLGKKN